MSDPGDRGGKEKDELVGVFSSIDEGSAEMWNLPSDAVGAGILPVALLFPERKKKMGRRSEKAKDELTKPKRTESLAENLAVKTFDYTEEVERVCQYNAKIS